MGNIDQQITEFWQATEDLAVQEEINAQDALNRLSTCSLEEMLLLFRHYRLFTIRHIDDLAIVMGRLPFSEFKAFVAKVMYEEFGMETEAGYQNNHVYLLDAFMVSLGASPEWCRDPKVELPSNVALLGEITERCQSASLPFAIGLRGMGTECLCQVYLTAIFDNVEKNPHFQANRDQLDLRFEQLHRGEVEAEHRRQMRARIADMVRESPELLDDLQQGYHLARVSFHSFFANIYDHIDEQTPKRVLSMNQAQTYGAQI